MARVTQEGFEKSEGDYGHMGQGRLYGGHSYVVRFTGANAAAAGVNVFTGTGLSEFYARFYFLVHTLPTTETRIWGFSNSTEGVDQAAYLTLKSDGKIYGYNKGNIARVQIGVSTTALVTERWYRVNVHVVMRGGGASGSGSVSLKLDGTSEFSGTYSASANGINVVGATAGNIFVSTHNGADEDDGGWMEFDDFVADNSAEPGPGGITRLYVRGQGTHAAWTGDYRSVIHDPPTLAAASQANVNTTSTNVATTYTFETMASKGLSGVTVKSTRVLAFGILNFGADMKYRIRKNGADFDSAGFAGGSGVFAGTAAITISNDGNQGWMQDAGTFSLSPSDTLEAGIVSATTSASTRRLNAVYFDVDWEGTDPVTPTLLGGVVMEHGTYTGNGTVQQISLANAALDPTMLIILPMATTAARVLWHWGQGLNGTHAGRFDSNSLTDRSTSLALVTVGAFHVTGGGTAVSVNESGVVYRYLAIQDQKQRVLNCGSRRVSPQDSTLDSTNIALDNRTKLDETTLTFASGFIINALFAAARQWGAAIANRVWFRTSNYTGDAASQTDANATAVSADAIQSQGTGTFQVGTLCGGNSAQGIMDWVAISDQDAVFNSTRLVEVGTYVGDATNPRVIPFVKMTTTTPAFLLVVPENAAARYARFYTDGAGTTSRALFAGATSTLAVTAFDTIGQFTVNSALNASGVVYHFLVFGAGTDADSVSVTGTGGVVIGGAATITQFSDIRQFIQRCDTGDTDTLIAGDVLKEYVATVRSRPFSLSGLLNRHGGLAGRLVAGAIVDGEVLVKLVGDFGGAGRTVSREVSLTPEASEDTVISPIDDLSVASLRVSQIEFTDAAEVAEWELHQFGLKATKEETA